MKFYVFGYGSLLSTASTASTTGDHSHHQTYIPARLYGYSRSWDAVRHSNQMSEKKYLRLDNWDITDKFCWCNIKRSADNDFLNGICYEIDEKDFIKLDYRETGYTRIDISKHISPYLGHSLETDAVVYTYIDTHPLSFAELPDISMDYVNMITSGAWSINKSVDGFFSDYIASTHTPTANVNNIKQVYFDGSGFNLYMLDERDSSSVLLHSFHHSQLTSEPIPNRPSIQPVQYDKYKFLSKIAQDLEAAKSPNTSSVELNNLSQHDNWLVKLVSCDNPNMPKSIVDQLKLDPDNWVARCASNR